MRTPTKSARHAVLSREYPPDLNPVGFAGTGPHRRRRSRTKRFLLLVAGALAFAAYRYLTT